VEGEERCGLEPACSLQPSRCFSYAASANRRRAADSATSRWPPACTPRRSMRGQSQGMAGVAVRNVTTSTPELTGRLRAASRPENELTPECETLAASQIVYAAAQQIPLPPCWCCFESACCTVVLKYLTLTLRPLTPRRCPISLPAAGSLPGYAPRLRCTAPAWTLPRHTWLWRVHGAPSDCCYAGAAPERSPRPAPPRAPRVASNTPVETRRECTAAEPLQRRAAGARGLALPPAGPCPHRRMHAPRRLGRYTWLLLRLRSNWPEPRSLVE
jgi:hypothetical protein